MSKNARMAELISVARQCTVVFGTGKKCSINCPFHGQAFCKNHIIAALLNEWDKVQSSESSTAEPDQIHTQILLAIHGTVYQSQVESIRQAALIYDDDHRAGDVLNYLDGVLQMTQQTLDAFTKIFDENDQDEKKDDQEEEDDS